jgi:dethiobiotin synthetase
MSVAYFVTGTDTSVGKTTVAAALLQAARRHGLSTAASKPVASGCQHTRDGLRNADALALLEQSSLALRYEEVNPYAFAPAIAPHLAARDVAVPLDVASVLVPVRHLLGRQADFTLVEGAGGWRVPLSGRESLSDLAVALGLPVILVVAVRLGCLNHALLTAEAICRDGLQLAGWVGNLLEPYGASLQGNIETLRQRLAAPCLGCVPYLEETTAGNVADFLDLSLLEL